MRLRNYLLVLIFVLSFAFTEHLFAALQFAGGVGTEGNPWQISNWEHLNNVRNYLGVGHNDKHFKLINNIDSTTFGYDIYASVTANSDSGWIPIGSGNDVNAFQGTFDGDSFTISGLFIDRADLDNVGLFGFIQNSMIKNIGVIDFYCTGNRYVGGLVGFSDNGVITKSYARGNVSSIHDIVGGLVGYSESLTITNCYTIVNVNSTGNYVGGLVGYNGDGIITNSYAVGRVIGTNHVGGLVGRNWNGIIENSYGAGKITGSSDVGGLIGSSSIDVTNCFYDIFTTCQSDEGKGLGLPTANLVKESTFADSGWNFTDTWSIISNQSYPFFKWQISDIFYAIDYSVDTVVSHHAGGQIIISADTQLAGGTISISVIVFEGYEFDSWVLIPDIGTLSSTTDTEVIYTFADTNISIMANFVENDFAGGDGSSSTSYLISNWKHLNNVRNYLGAGHNDKYFKLINNIDSNTYGYDTYASSVANNDSGWAPIGWDLDNSFCGTFDGDSFTISGLYINRPATINVGLFGYSNNSTIKNIGLIDFYCTGNSYVGGLVGINDGGRIIKTYARGYVNATGNIVGGLVGSNSGIIEYSFTAENVQAQGDFLGGLVGNNDGPISNSYSTSKVTGNGNFVGGLIGLNNNGTITNSYAIGKTTGNLMVGGLLGFSNNDVTNSFYDIFTTGQSDEGKGLGLPTADLVKESTFSDSGWNFTDTWSIISNQSYPFFKWQINNIPYANLVSVTLTSHEIFPYMTNNTEIDIFGIIERGDTVYLYIDGIEYRAILTQIYDDTADWSWTINQSFGLKVNDTTTIFIIGEDEDGNKSDTLNFSIFVDTAPPISVRNNLISDTKIFDRLKPEIDFDGAFSDSVGIVSYEIRYDTGSDFGNAKFDTVTVSPWTPSETLSYEIWYIEIKAIDLVGNISEPMNDTITVNEPVHIIIPDGVGEDTIIILPHILPDDHDTNYVVVMNLDDTYIIKASNEQVAGDVKSGTWVLTVNFPDTGNSVRLNKVKPSVIEGTTRDYVRNQERNAGMFIEIKAYNKEEEIITDFNNINLNLSVDYSDLDVEDTNNVLIFWLNTYDSIWYDVTKPWQPGGAIADNFHNDTINRIVSVNMKHFSHYYVGEGWTDTLTVVINEDIESDSIYNNDEVIVTSVYILGDTVTNDTLTAFTIKNAGNITNDSIAAVQLWQGIPESGIFIDTLPWNSDSEVWHIDNLDIAIFDTGETFYVKVKFADNLNVGDTFQARIPAASVNSVKEYPGPVDDRMNSGILTVDFAPCEIGITSPSNGHETTVQTITISGIKFNANSSDTIEIFLNNESYVSFEAGITIEWATAIALELGENIILVQLRSGINTDSDTITIYYYPVGFETDLNNVVIVPNPFRPNDGNEITGLFFTGSANDIYNRTGIHILKLTDNVKIEIYDILGRRVRTLSNIEGYGMAIWDGKKSNGINVASGTYLFVISNDFQRKVLKAAIIR